MAFKATDCIWTLVVITLINTCLCEETMEQFTVSIDVSVLDSLSLICYEEDRVRGTLESTVICSREIGCRAVRRPSYWCECPPDPFLRTWQSNTLWRQAHLWMPQMELPSKHFILNLSILAIPIEAHNHWWYFNCIWEIVYSFHWIQLDCFLNFRSWCFFSHGQN